MKKRVAQNKAMPKEAISVQLPNRQEINPFDDLDGRVACKHFLGKNLQQAEDMFCECPDYYREDLLWMGPVAFRYYVRAAIDFLRRDNFAAEQSEFLAGFEGTLNHRLKCEPQELIPVANLLADVCGYIVDHWSRFNLESEFDGDLRSNYVKLQHALARLAGSAVNRDNA